MFAVEIFIITFNKWKKCGHQNGVCLTSIIDNREEKETVKKLLFSVRIVNVKVRV